MSNTFPAGQFASATANALAQVQPKLMYSKAEAAEMLGISERTVENLIAVKELTCRKIGRRVLIPFQALLDFTRRDHDTGRSGVKPN